MKYVFLAVLLAALALGGLLAAGPESGQSAYPGVNGQIVFRSNRSGDHELWVMNPDGSNQTNITNSPAFDHDPSWSADGEKIVFQSERGEGDDEIWIMDADGGNPVQLTDNDWQDYDPVLSPDGSRIAWTSLRDSPNGDIFVMNLDGSDPVNLTPGLLGEGNATWGPNNLIAFNSISGPAGIYTMQPDGSEITPLANGFDPNWSPDGELIVFSSLRDGGAAELYVMDADGGSQTRITNTDDYEEGPAWSPDGTMITFFGYADDDDGDIYVMPYNGAATASANVAVDITNSPGQDEVPDWGPMPEPTPTPEPAGLAGDADCDEDVDAVDALQDLRFVAGFQPFADCIEDGNVKCDDPIDAIDALFILRKTAGLPVNLPQGCPEIGT